MKEMRITPARLQGTVSVPPSKSYSHRALICAAMAGEGARVIHSGDSRDIEATKRVLEGLGKKYISDGNDGGFFLETKAKEAPLSCGESGSTLRFMIPLALVFRDHAEFVGEGRLMERPLDPYYPIFEQCGIIYRKEETRLSLEGRLKSGVFHLPGNLSSQFVSGLLMSLPLLSGDSRIILDSPLESTAYVDMTIDVMKRFGVTAFIEGSGYHIPGNQTYRPTRYTVEGDYSQAAFFLAAGALGGDVICTGLPEDSIQGDRVILPILEEAGATIRWVDHGLRATGGVLTSFRADVSECPDLAPILAVLAAYSEGESLIYNAGRLRFKESDRLSAIAAELTNIGALVTEGEDFLRISGKPSLPGGSVLSHNDHRIAMSLAIASERCTGPMILGGGECVSKSMPDFWDLFCQLGGNVDERNMG